MGTLGESSCRTHCGRFAPFVGWALGLTLVAGAQAAPGNPDVTFGMSGLVAPLFSGVANSRVGEMVIQPDGKIVVAGECGFTTTVFCVARRLANGSPDPDFGTQGTVVTTDQIGNGGVVKILLQPSGKLVIAGTCSPSLFCAIRFNSNGTRDGTFGTNGKATVTNRIGVASTEAFSQQRDGKLVFAGACNSAAHCVARIGPNGSTDNSFGGDGVVFVAVPLAVQTGSINTRAISEQVDGKLVLSGQCRLMAEPPLPVADVACAFRRQSDGAPDLSYGNNGFASARFSATERFSVGASVGQPDDAVVIGGRCASQDNKSCMMRFDRGGKVDSSLQTTASPPLFHFILALAVQTDGKILAAGRCVLPLISGDRTCFQRYNSDGSPDASLPLVVGEILESTGGSIAAQADGKIVVASNYFTVSDQAVSLNRYLGGSFGNSECSLDIDGDGVVNPAIDGVILTRAMMGFSGPNVYAGIAFSANATRKQWGTGGSDDIRKFLVSQCGMKPPL